MSGEELWLVGNVGAEEARPGALHPHAHAVARLLALCLPASGKLLTEAGPEPVASFWPASLGPPRDTPAFAWLGQHPDHAWLTTLEAQDLLAHHGRGGLVPAPEIVQQVHDKAFTWRVCNEQRLTPRPLRGLELVLDPDELGAPDAATRLQAQVESWPDWIQARFALKPRYGSSGRGRVPGEQGRLDVDPVRAALPRLAARGGAVLEPWLTRRQDLSVQLHLSEDGSVTLLGTLEQLMSPAGVYRGHLGRVDHRGRVTSATDWDDALLETAMELARAAHGVGFHGPCGIDGFSFEGPRGPMLRPAVEFNARFTTGTLLVGLVRRALTSVAAEIGLAPGAPRFFYFALDAPEGGWPSSTSKALRVVALGAALEGCPAALEPALAFAPDPETLREALSL